MIPLHGKSQKRKHRRRRNYCLRQRAKPLRHGRHSPLKVLSVFAWIMTW
jgi:hypothetical protein